jgi:sugar lactone lactonase YvrE
MDKKSLPYTLVCILILAALAACSGGEAPPQFSITPTPTPGTAANDTPSLPTEAPVELSERPSQVWVVSLNGPAGYLYRSFLQIPVGMAWGPDGYLYIGDWAGHHIVRVAPDYTMDDLGLWQRVKALREDGPRGLAFDSRGNLYINNHGNIFRYDTSGNIEALPGVSGSPVGSIAVSPSDELYYTDRGGGKLLKWSPENGSQTVATGLPLAENLVFGLDGTLYLTQMSKGNVLKVDLASGESQIFAANVCGFDPCYLAVDPEGDIWVRGINQLHQLAPDGAEKPFLVNGQSFPGGPYSWHTAAGIAFDKEGGLWIGSYNSKLIHLVPLMPGTADPEFTLQVASPGLEASDLALDPDGALYATDLNAGQVLKINPDQSVEVYLQHESAGRTAVAVDSQGAVFLGLPRGEIVRVEADGSLSHYADLLTRRMVFGADGFLYAVVGDYEQSKTIVRISGVDSYATLATKINGTALGSGEVHLSPALDQGLYVFSERGRNLYFLDFQGQGRLIANLQSLGGGGPVVMAASPVSGDIYYIPHGPYILFRIDPEGHSREVAYGVFGDPWGMVVSQDGQWLYVAESGVIDLIPIGD